MGTMSSIRNSAQRLAKGIVIILVIVLAAGAFFIGGGRARTQSQSNLYKGPSASVDGVKINDKDFNALLAEKRTQFFQWGGALSDELIKNIVLEDAISQQLIKNAQKKMGTTATNKEVNAFMDKLRKRFPTEEEWNMLIYQTGSTSERELRGRVRDYLKHVNFILALAAQDNMTVSDEEILAAYEKVEASHILIRVKTDAKDTEGHTEAEARKMINDIHAKLLAGADFAEMAGEKSEDPGSKANGGSLGYFGRGDMVAEFDKVAFELKVGEMSAPVKTSFGYHIIKVTNRRDPESPEFKEDKVDLQRELLVQQYQEKKFGDWLENQKKNAKIEILDPALRAYRLKSEEKWKEAAVAYEKAIQKNKKNLDLYLSLADVYRQGKEPAKAAELMAKARKIWPEDLQLALKQAEAYIDLKDNAKTAELLKLASGKAGDDIAIRQEIKGLYELAGLAAEAQTEQAEIDRILEKQSAEQNQASDDEEEDEDDTN